MADKSFFGRLQNLFSSSTIIRKAGDKKLKVVDINKVQSTSRLATNRLVDRFNRLYSSEKSFGYNQISNYHTARIQLFTDYEMMDEDSIISSALDIYAEAATLKNEYGDCLEIKSSSDEVEKVLHNLFYDILNIEFNLWPWVRNMCKYGDFYLKMDITEKFGVTNVLPISTYEMIREEGLDPARPDYVRFTHDPSLGGSMTGIAGQTAKTEYQAYEVAHFRMLSDSNFLPYGKSMVEPARKNWKQLTLMEDAMMIHRIMRAPEKRIFKIDIGNIPPNEVDNYMQRVMNQMKKTPYVDGNTGQYNLKFNLQNMMEDFYLPVRGGSSGSEIESLSGMEFGGIDDIEYLRNRMFSALRIPKAFLGYDESISGKATLAAEDVRFARTIERIQKIVISELTKIALVHLYSQGFEGEDLVNFELGLTNPSTIHEQEKLELWSTKVDLVSNMKDLNMMSSEWIYNNVFKLSDQDMEKEKAGVIEDLKQEFRKEQIKMEGNDPMKSGEAKGTPHVLATIAQPEEGKEGGEGGGEEVDDTDFAEEGAKAETPGPDASAPKAGKSQKSARGRDPLGKEGRNYKFSENKYLVKNLFKSKKTTKAAMLSENNIIDEDTL